MARLLKNKSCSGDSSLAKTKKVCYDKGIESNTMEGLMAKFQETIRQRSGIPLGGIGTGTVELFPDGELHEWQIYNTARWASCCREAKVDDGEAYTGALAFFLRAEEENGSVTLRRLGFHTDSDEFTYRMFTSVKPVERIAFDGRFPTADLTYYDEALPCTVSSQWIAPFVPHKEDLSATPAFSVTFTLTNPTPKPLRLSLAGKLKTAFCNAKGQTHARFDEGKTTTLSITPAENRAPSDGSLAFSVTGEGTNTALLGDYEAYLDEYVAHSDYGISQESFLFPFLEKGELPDSSAASALPDDFFPDETAYDTLDEGALDAKLARLADYAFAQSLMARIQAVYPAFPAGLDDKKAFLAVAHRQVWDISRNKEKPFGAAALCHTLTLAPKESTSIRFVFSWHFPNHIGQDDRFLGHYYARLHPDALAVNRYALQHYNEIFGAAARFSATLYNTTLPEVYPDALSSQLSTLVKDSWWLADGGFGLWEGLGYCGFATTDITYHASHGLAVLFPALQKKQMKMTAAFCRADGRIPHYFTPDLYHVDNGFHRVDMNPQFVLLVARDYLVQGDREHLADLYPTVVAAMEATAALDRNGDGLPDSDTAYNTYDAWHFHGTPSYIAFLWLSALKAAGFLAEIMGDAANREKWETIRKKGLSSAEAILYNGSYYDLWTTASPDDPAPRLAEHDECLMSNQLDGEVFLRLVGLGGNLPDERFASVLAAIYDSNYEKGAGLVNASNLPGRPLTMYTYQNCQAQARWTGVEYLFAAALESIGEHDKAETLIATIHECQARLGYFFNHWECGFRYTRPLSSWLTLSAVSGYTVNAEKNAVSLLPPSGSQTAIYPLITAFGSATAAFSPDAFTLTLLEGNLTLSSLTLPYAPEKAVRARSKTPLALTKTAADGGVTLTFSEPLTLCDGDCLTVVFA